MRRGLKILLISVALVTLSFIAAASWFLATLDSEAGRERFAALVGLAIGREATIDGSIARSRAKKRALFTVGRPVQLSGTLAEPAAEFAGSRFANLGRWVIGHPIRGLCSCCSVNLARRRVPVRR